LKKGKSGERNNKKKKVGKNVGRDSERKKKDVERKFKKIAL
jgi:hypothetical protein